jgi:integrase
VVPAALRPAVEQRELFETLDTTNHEVAKLRYPMALARINAKLLAARGDGAADDTILLEWQAMVARREALRERPGRLDTVHPLMGDVLPSLPLKTLLDDWAREKKVVEKTRYSWERILRKLTKHIGHDDLTRVTEADVIAWKDALVKAGELAATTIENHLIVARTIFAYAFDNRRIATKPARAVKYTAKPDARTKRRGFNDDEARTILAAARQAKDALRRWVPWLAAMTGARIDEICGAMVRDIEQVDGVWCIHIRPDHREAGGRVKNEASVRTVPLHDCLIAEGFLEYVKVRKQEQLFPDVKPDCFGRRGGNGSKVLARWVRETLGIDHPRIQPAHGWRHRFADVCRKHGVPRDVRFAIDGHAMTDEGDRYGEGYTPAALKEWLDRIPSPLAGSKTQ